MALEYVLYADESVARGEFFSNFYGGCLVASTDLQPIVDALNAKKAALNLHGEVKWQKVSAAYLSKYETLMEAFFDLVAAGRIKVRVMFTQNRYLATGLSPEHRESAYFILYYQFVKHAFGLGHVHHELPFLRLRLYLDALPDTYEKRARFRGYLGALSHSPEFRDARIVLDETQIAEVDSHDHVLLQCTDVVLGAMQFRLNDLHKKKPSGASRRGSRTIAKEKLYAAIVRRIRSLHPHFNPGITTGQSEGTLSRWRDPYRHWLFMPAERVVDASKSKRTTK